MKKIGIILTVMLMASISCKDNKDSKEAPADVSEAQPTIEMADASFSSTSTGAVYLAYQELRKALVASDAAGAQKAADRLSQALEDEQGEAVSISTSMADTSDLEEIRNLFSDLTASLDPLFRESLESGEIYQQFCPMAFEGKGGFWFSDKEEIRNPYYGDKMLTCGKVTEVITQ
ncbi:DUF3347 domain-containing protein [Muriicola marianensis]|uniref:DUF3347 domain-containing protein n=1 Tax=Muriicola marianensis TaxID=1324801 RepID=A0ABQ1R4T4_9FLAO|nr:DUF3347 domain-containing protein [Muriicola marianensis]GGD58190.1 hypothetical protein GCM10011361_25730 [Muriicola marianensis]